MSGRCVSCDSKLTEEEMCRKRHDTGGYLDMCTPCLREVNEIVELPVDLAYFGHTGEEKEGCIYYEEGEV